MSILISIAINSSLTSKRAHVCSSVAIETSLVVLLGFPSVSEKEKGLEPQFNCLNMRGISLSIDIISLISMVVMCDNEFRWWCPNFRAIQWLTNSGS